MDWDQWVRIWTLLLLGVSTVAFVVQTHRIWGQMKPRRQWLCFSLVLYQLAIGAGLVGRLIENNAPLGWGLPVVWVASVSVLYAVIRGHVWEDEDA